MRLCCLLAVILAPLQAGAAVTHPKPGLTLVRHTSTAMVVADLCAAGVSVRATKYSERRATPRGWATRSGVNAQAAVNADFFDFPGWTLVNGRARGDGADWPADKQYFESRSYWQFGPALAGLQPDAHVVPPGSNVVSEIVGGHNILIANGVNQGPGFDGDGVILSSHRRTAIGISADRRHLYLFVSATAMNGSQLVDALVQHAAEAGAPPIAWATNMDGGGSSQMYVEGVGGIMETGREVNNHLGIRATGGGASPNCPASCTNGCPMIAQDRVAFASSRSGAGYLAVTSSGLVYAAGNRREYGSLLGVPLNAPVTGVALTQSGLGYFLTADDGGVFAFGDAVFSGSLGGQPLNAPVVDIAVPSTGGYWLVARDGGVFAFGGAGFYGSMGGQTLNAPIVGMTAAPDGRGYWLVASDGGIFAFGSAGFHGSMGGQSLNAPVVGMAAAPDGEGYWLVASDGGIFAFGSAGFFGSMGGQPLAAPVVAMARTWSGAGYWLLGGDGGIFAFGDAPFLGSPVANVGCAGTDVLVCTASSNGCNEWEPQSSCTGGQVCRLGRCESTCTDDCSAGQTRCDGTRVQACGETDSDACLDWAPARDCGVDKTCSAGSCTSSTCSDACVAGAARCASGSAVESCVTGGEGCLAWGNVTSCETSQICEQGGCHADSTGSGNVTDGGTPEDASVDAGQAGDSGNASEDAGRTGTDAGEAGDASTTGTDAGVPDASDSDAGLRQDAGAAGSVDAGSGDRYPPTTNCHCGQSAPDDAGGTEFMALAVLLLGRRRR